VSGLLESLDGDPDVDAQVGDAAFVRAMLDAEIGLVRALARAGIAPADAVNDVVRTCDALDVDPSDLGRRSVAAGSPVVPLVQDLLDVVPPAARPWVHFGATSQDIVDTALMLIAHRALANVNEHLGAAAGAAAALAERHRDTVMVARTLGQQAIPTTFGAKAAGWCAGLDRAQTLLQRIDERGLAVQLGGAAGTLAPLGSRGLEVMALFADELGLTDPGIPWHTERSRLHRLAGALGSSTDACAKVATDVIWMAQREVGEAAEGGGVEHGGSSAMPHKRNPSRSVLITAAARRTPFLVGTVLGAGVHEHERAIGSWHAEWSPLRDLLRLAGGAAAHTADLLSGLVVDPERMAHNLEAAGEAVLAESVAARLAPSLGREEAQRIVRKALASVTPGHPFREALLEDPEASRSLGRDGVRAALDPAAYLGSATAIVDRVLAARAARQAGAAPTDGGSP